jgi:hypothetical protein
MGLMGHGQLLFPTAITRKALRRPTRILYSGILRAAAPQAGESLDAQLFTGDEVARRVFRIIQAPRGT